MDASEAPRSWHTERRAYKPRSLITITEKSLRYPVRKLLKQLHPMRFPGSFLLSSHHFPGYWNGTAPIHDADHQHRKTFLQGRRIQSQRQPWLIGRPPGQNPLKPRSKTGAHVQFSTLLPFFVFSAIAPFAQALQQTLF